MSANGRRRTAEKPPAEQATKILSEMELKAQKACDYAMRTFGEQGKLAVEQFHSGVSCIGIYSLADRFARLTGHLITLEGKKKVFGPPKEIMEPDEYKEFKKFTDECKAKMKAKESNRKVHGGVQRLGAVLTKALPEPGESDSGWTKPKNSNVITGDGSTMETNDEIPY